MKRWAVKTKHMLYFIRQAPHSRIMITVLAATIAVLIDSVFRFSDYRALMHLLPGIGILKFSGALSLAFLQVVAVFYLFSLLPRLLGIVALLLSFLVGILQFSYWHTLDQFMTATDVLLALTVGGDHRIEAILSFFAPRVILYTIPYMLILFILIILPPACIVRKSIVFSILPVLFLTASNYALFLHVPERGFHLNPLTSFVRSAFHYEYENLHAYEGPRDRLPGFHASQRPLDSIIYVIDESVRGSNLSLNGYPRPTTPFLQSLETQGLLRNLGIGVAAGTFSHLSNAYLITGHNEFPDRTFRTVRNPTVFDYAKSMGYETIYIDINHGYLPLLLKEAGDGPVRSLDRWMNDSSFTERSIDLESEKDIGVARFLSNLLNTGSGYFIVVNKKGLHFHYRNRFPDNAIAKIWKPVMEASEPIEASAGGREKLVNTYDNGIRFQVDEFFRVFVSETTNRNYVILYTSDHGQTLAQDGQTYSHMKSDSVIADVPAFLVSGDQYGKKDLLAGILPGIRISHLNNFATLLDLMGTPMSLRVRPYEKSIFSLTADDNRERSYMSGSLHGTGDYVIKSIPTPPDAGWGFSLPVGKKNLSE